MHARTNVQALLQTRPPHRFFSCPKVGRGKKKPPATHLCMRASMKALYISNDEDRLQFYKMLAENSFESDASKRYNVYFVEHCSPIRPFYLDFDFLTCGSENLPMAAILRVVFDVLRRCFPSSDIELIVCQPNAKATGKQHCNVDVFKRGIHVYCPSIKVNDETHQQLLILILHAYNLRASTLFANLNLLNKRGSAAPDGESHYKQAYAPEFCEVPESGTLRMICSNKAAACANEDCPCRESKRRCKTDAGRRYSVTHVFSRFAREDEFASDDEKASELQGAFDTAFGLDGAQTQELHAKRLQLLLKCSLFVFDASLMPLTLSSTDKDVLRTNIFNASVCIWTKKKNARKRKSISELRDSENKIQRVKAFSRMLVSLAREDILEDEDNYDCFEIDIATSKFSIQGKFVCPCKGAAHESNTCEYSLNRNGLLCFRCFDPQCNDARRYFHLCNNNWLAKVLPSAKASDYKPTRKLNNVDLAPGCLFTRAAKRVMRQHELEFGIGGCVGLEPDAMSNFANCAYNAL